VVIAPYAMLNAYRVSISKNKITDIARLKEVPQDFLHA